MLVEGIAHAVLPGIVVGYAFTLDLNSPWLIVGAALAGLLVVLVNVAFIAIFYPKLKVTTEGP